MRRRQHRLLICSVLLSCLTAGMLAASCRSTPPTTTSGVQLPAVQPADFGFVAAYGAYGRNQIDTFNGTFTKDIISQTRPNPTVELRLTPEELASLYRDLRAMRILDYPSVMDTTNTGITASTPTSYRLDIRAGGIEKSISWGHGEFAGTPEAKALLDWFKKLQDMIEAKPEYQRMPPLEGGYAMCSRGT
jgi:hypothetical protein